MEIESSQDDEELKCLHDDLVENSKKMVSG